MVAPVSSMELPRRRWSAFCQAFSPVLRASVVEVEVSGLGLEDRIATQWARLAEISFDEAHDALALGVHGADRIVPHPAAIRVHRGAAGVQSLEVVQGDGSRVFVVFRQPLALREPPAPKPARTAAVG